MLEQNLEPSNLSKARHSETGKAQMKSSISPARKFQFVLIKPSHYGADGYVIRWWRGMIPSNSLAAVFGVARDCIDREVLGPDIEIDIEAIDEFSERIDIEKLIERFKRNGNFGLVALVGVQSNQYPRALDLARPLRAAGISVAIGGFHVSGCLSMLDGKAIDLDLCRDMGVSIFAGEIEHCWKIHKKGFPANALIPPA